MRFAALVVAALALGACQGSEREGDAPPAAAPAPVPAPAETAIGSASAGEPPVGGAVESEPAAATVPEQPGQSVPAPAEGTPGSDPAPTSGSGEQPTQTTQDVPDVPEGLLDTGVVRFVPDGDTIELEDGRAVRLVQIDAPELNPAERAECHGREAQRLLRRLAPVGSTVELVRDPALDDVDRFDRLLRYVRVDGRVLNLVLVAEGAATPYFFRGDRGRLAGRLLAAARDARDAGRGLWGACPAAELQPGRGADTGSP